MAVVLLAGITLYSCSLPSPRGPKQCRILPNIRKISSSISKHSNICRTCCQACYIFSIKNPSSTLQVNNREPSGGEGWQHVSSTINSSTNSSVGLTAFSCSLSPVRLKANFYPRIFALLVGCAFYGVWGTGVIVRIHLYSLKTVLHMMVVETSQTFNVLDKKHVEIGYSGISIIFGIPSSWECSQLRQSAVKSWKDFTCVNYVEMNPLWLPSVSRTTL